MPRRKFKVGKARLPKVSGRISSTSELNAKARGAQRRVDSFSRRVLKGV